MMKMSGVKPITVPPSGNLPSDDDCVIIGEIKRQPLGKRNANIVKTRKEGRPSPSSVRYVNIKKSAKEGDEEAVKKIKVLKQKSYCQALDFLSDTGYHRARCTSLTKYDAVIGGIVWLLNKVLGPSGQELHVTFKESANKEVEDKKLEAEAIQKALQFLKYPYRITPKDMYEPKFLRLGRLIQFLIGHMVAMDHDVEKNCTYFTSFFDTTYQDRDIAERDFLRRLFQPSDHRMPDTDRIKLFDSTLIHMPNMSAPMLIAEYYNYARSSVRFYQKYFDRETYLSEGGTEAEFEEVQSEVPDVLEKLSSLGNELLEYGKASPMAQDFSHVFNVITILDMGNTLKLIEERFSVDANNFYDLQREFKRINEQCVELAKYDDAAQVGRVKGMAERVVELKNHCQVVFDCLKADVDREHELEVKLCENKDENGKLQKYCPFLREKAHKQRDVRINYDKLLDECQELKTRVDSVWDDFIKGQTHFKKVDLPEDEEEDENLRRRFHDWDYTLEEEIGLVILHCKSQLEEFNAISIKFGLGWFETVRLAANAIITDYIIILRDRKQKAKWHAAYRQKFYYSFLEVQAEINKKKQSMLHQAQNFRNLQRVNHTVLYTTRDLHKLECQSATFRLLPKQSTNTSAQ